MCKIEIFFLVSLICGIHELSASNCEGGTAGSDYISIIHSHTNWSYNGVSINYPNNYHRCWLIKSELSGKVKLTFNLFQLQAKDGSGVCKDWLKVYDGDEEDPTKLKMTYCGNESQVSVTSMDEELLMVFSTDGSITDKGFLIEYHAVDWEGPGESSGTGIIAIIVIGVVVIGVVAAVLGIIWYFTCFRNKHKKQVRQCDNHGFVQSDNKLNYPTVSTSALPPKV